MILTEKDARFNVCPVSIRADREENHSRNCLASKCMAWRPVLSPELGQGYCGMAGTPVELQSRAGREYIEAVMAAAKS